MKINKADSDKLLISPICEIRGTNGRGILGFTINNPDGTFDNIIRSFTVDNHNMILAEIIQERQLRLNNKK